MTPHSRYVELILSLLSFRKYLICGTHIVNLETSTQLLQKVLDFSSYISKQKEQ